MGDIIKVEQADITLVGNITAEQLTAAYLRAETGSDRVQIYPIPSPVQDEWVALIFDEDGRSRMRIETLYTDDLGVLRGPVLLVGMAADTSIRPLLGEELETFRVEWSDEHGLFRLIGADSQLAGSEGAA